MNTNTIEYVIGLDIAKSTFQVHKESAGGTLIEQKQLKRAQLLGYFKRQPRCLIGIEACGTAHYWARTLQALGHEVKLIPPAYVKPYVRRNKTDARDAAAICKALKEEDMTFVPIKSPEQQASRALERSRYLLLKQCTQLRNSLRSQLAEHGVVARGGKGGFDTLAQQIRDGSAPVPEQLVAVLQTLLEHIDSLARDIQLLEDRIAAAAKANADMRRIATIPGIGPITAHAIVTAIGDGKQFRTARDCAAWAGMTPRINGTAGKNRHGRISRKGENHLRRVLVLGASTLMRHARTRSDSASAWQRGILARRPVKVAVVAQAARNIRIAWAVLVSGGVYQPRRACAR